MISGQLLTSPAQSIERSKNPKHIPSVLEPTQDDWTLFDATNRELLGRFLRSPVQYMDSPALHTLRAERSLFGARASLFGDATRFTTMPRLPKNANGLLSAAQEHLLFQQLNYVRMRKLRLLWQFRMKHMPVDKLRLLLAWGCREIEIRTHIVEPNMPLVLAMIRKSRWSNMDNNDLLSEGSFALLRSVDKFDCGLGFKFSTYACRAILKGFARVGTTTNRNRSRCPIMFDPAMEPSDFMERKHENTVSMCVVEIREILADNRAELTVREQAVIHARFLLGTNPESRHLSLAQVGTRIGVTKERVRQIQNKALAKLRTVMG